MYLKRSLLVVLTVLSFSGVWNVESLRQRRTTTPSWIEVGNTEPVTVEIEEGKRYHHKPQNPTQYPQHYPPQYTPQDPSHNQPQYIPQNPPQYQPQNPSSSPPQYILQNPPSSPPQYTPQNPSQNPPLYLQPKPTQNPPQYVPQNPPQNPPLYLQPKPPQKPPHYVPQNPPINPPQYLQLKPTKATPPPEYKPLAPVSGVPTITVKDQFDNRYPDGSYEFRYELWDETVRYERGYYIRYLSKDILVVKGYYSYRLRDLRYLTVFYTADQNGFRHDSSTISFQRPNLPRSINIRVNLNDEVDESSARTNSTEITENKLN